MMEKDSSKVDVSHYTSPEKLLEYFHILSKVLPDEKNLAIESKVTLTNRSKAFIPMMDLSIKKSPENLKKIISLVKKHLCKDFGDMLILETDASYHLLGLTLLTIEKQIQFLGRCARMKIKKANGEPQTIIDLEYLFYSMDNCLGSTALRITAHGKKSLPKVIAIVTTS